MPRRGLKEIGRDTMKFNGKILKKIREQKHVNQIDLCNAINCSQSLLSMYERCSRMPRVYRIKQIADYLGVPYETFFGETEKDLRPQRIAITIKQARLNACLTQGEARSVITKEICVARLLRGLKTFANCMGCQQLT
jgi:transcriptional regulator with XRE-family HTH domain